jgi:hypothetical protein
MTPNRQLRDLLIDPVRCSFQINSRDRLAKDHLLVILTHSFMVGLGMMLLVFIQMGGVSQVILRIPTVLPF